jgi:hypothetical protein
VLFAAFLGYNPIKALVGPHVLAQLSPANSAALTGRSFFPTLISGPFHHGLHEAFVFSIVACLVAAAASWSRGARYVDGELDPAATGGAGLPPRGAPSARAGAAEPVLRSGTSAARSAALPEGAPGASG